MSSRQHVTRPIEAVVIGASSGGVQALLQLLPALHSGTQASIFVVLHMPRDRPSRLVEIFAQRCSLPIREAEDKEAVAPGIVYFAPPNYHLLVDDGRQLALSADDPVCHSRPSIDVLFESAADVYQERLMGVILTGANDDGARGLAAVHGAGGVTVVQRPDTAQAPQMVLSALKTHAVDFVLPLEQIADLFGALDARPTAGPL